MICLELRVQIEMNKVERIAFNSRKDTMNVKNHKFEIT